MEMSSTADTNNVKVEVTAVEVASQSLPPHAKLAHVLATFVSGVIALWTVVFLVLLVWNVVKNHHYFGCVPHVACVDGAWPSS